ncbi:MAG: transcription antitermination factor NusB, partial [Acholeplasmataceae bacterium]
NMTRRELREQVVLALYIDDLLKTLPKLKNEKVKNLFNEVKEKELEIDELIISSLENYALNRLSFVDRAIVRLATYEMKFTETPKGVIINEAIEITKKYADIDDKQYKFTNKLLDNIKKGL